MDVPFYIRAAKRMATTSTEVVLKLREAPAVYTEVPPPANCFLLTDAVKEVTGRFARQDYVEEAWRILDPVLDDATPVFEYEPGSWGPPEASTLAPQGGWIGLLTH